MCIVCNCDSLDDLKDGDFGSQFLTAFALSQREMKNAADAMLKCSKIVKDQKIAKKYDLEHKRMVRIIKEWNKTEHRREKNHEDQRL